MIIKNFNKNELASLLYDRDTCSFKIPVVQPPCKFDHFKDFHYFSPHHIFDQDGEQYFLIAYENDLNNIIGVIKYGWYGHGYRYQAVSYIDINQNYKRQGMSRKLISELNKYLTAETPLKLSFLSDEGELCHIDKLFIEGITVTNAIMEWDEFSYQGRIV